MNLRHFIQAQFMAKRASRYLVYLLSSMIVFGVTACEDDEVEPGVEITKISRLYVSFEEYGTTDERVDTNIRIIQPADSSVFSFRESHVSPVQGGGPIYFNPYAKMIFQASVNAKETDTLIAAVDVTKTGALNNIGAGLRSRYYDKVKGLVYHAATRSLMVVNGTGPNGGVYIVDNPRSSGNQKQPYKKLINPELNMWGAAYESDRLFTSKINTPAGIYMFQNLTAVSVSVADSIAGLNPTRTWRIENATSNLRGLSYDTIKNVMAIAEMGDGLTEGSGRILIFENFSEILRSPTDVIQPTRVITGSSTGLISPVDVAIDTRKDGVFLYVADRTAKKVSRFRYTDNGNVEPDKVIDTSGLGYGVTPVGLALDARDASTLDR